MFFGGHDHALTGLPAAFFRPAVREGEPPVVAGEKHGHERRVPVHYGLLARTVMLRVNVNGISRDWLWFRSCRHFASVNSWIRVPGNGAILTQRPPRPRQVRVIRRWGEWRGPRPSGGRAHAQRQPRAGTRWGIRAGHAPTAGLRGR